MQRIAEEDAAIEAMKRIQEDIARLRAQCDVNLRTIGLSDAATVEDESDAESRTGSGLSPAAGLAASARATSGTAVASPSAENSAQGNTYNEVSRDLDELLRLWNIEFDEHAPRDVATSRSGGCPSNVHGRVIVVPGHTGSRQAPSPLQYSPRGSGRCTSNYWYQQAKAILGIARKLHEQLRSERTIRASTNDAARQHYLDTQAKLCAISSDLTQNRIQFQQELDALKRSKDSAEESARRLQNELEIAKAKLTDSRIEVSSLKEQLAELQAKHEREIGHMHEEHSTSMKQARDEWESQRGQELEQLREKLKSTVRDLEKQHRASINGLAEAWRGERDALLSNIDKINAELVEVQRELRAEREKTEILQKVLEKQKQTQEQRFESIQSGPGSHLHYPLDQDAKRIQELELELDAARLEIQARVRDSEALQRRLDLREEVLTKAQNDLIFARKRIEQLEQFTRFAEFERDNFTEREKILRKAEEEVRTANVAIHNERIAFKTQLEEKTKEFEDRICKLKEEFAEREAQLKREFEAIKLAATSAAREEAHRSALEASQKDEAKLLGRLESMWRRIVPALGDALGNLSIEVKAAADLRSIYRAYTLESVKGIDTDPYSENTNATASCETSDAVESDTTLDRTGEASVIEGTSSFEPDAAGWGPNSGPLSPDLVNRIAHLESLTACAVAAARPKKTEVSQPRKVIQNAKCPALIIAGEAQDCESKYEAALGIPKPLAQSLARAFEDSSDLNSDDEDHARDGKTRLETDEPVSEERFESSKPRASSKPSIRSEGRKAKQPALHDARQAASPKLKESVVFKVVPSDGRLLELVSKLSKLKEDMTEISTSDENASIDGSLDKMVKFASVCVTVLRTFEEAARLLNESRTTAVHGARDSADEVNRLKVELEKAQRKVEEKRQSIGALRMRLKAMQEESLVARQQAEEARAVVRRVTEGSRKEIENALMSVSERVRIAAHEAAARARAEAEAEKTKEELRFRIEHQKLESKIERISAQLAQEVEHSQAKGKELEQLRHQNEQLRSEARSAKDAESHLTLKLAVASDKLRELETLVIKLKEESARSQDMLQQYRETIEVNRQQTDELIKVRTADAEARAARAERQLALQTVELDAARLANQSEVEILRKELEELKKKLIERVDTRANDSEVPQPDVLSLEEIERQARRATNEAKREVTELRAALETMRKEMDETVSAMSNNAQIAAREADLRVEQAKTEAMMKCKAEYELELQALEKRAAMMLRHAHVQWIHQLQSLIQDRDLEREAEDFLAELEQQASQWFARTRLGRTKRVQALSEDTSKLEPTLESQVILPMDEDRMCSPETKNFIARVTSTLRQVLATSRLAVRGQELPVDSHDPGRPAFVLHSPATSRSKMTIDTSSEQTRGNQQPSERSCLDQGNQSIATVQHPPQQKMHAEGTLLHSAPARGTPTVPEAKVNGGNVEILPEADATSHSMSSDQATKYSDVIAELRRQLEIEREAAAKRDELWQKEFLRRCEGPPGRGRPEDESNDETDDDVNFRSKDEVTRRQYRARHSQVKQDSKKDRVEKRTKTRPLTKSKAGVPIQRRMENRETSHHNPVSEVGQNMVEPAGVAGIPERSRPAASASTEPDSSQIPSAPSTTSPLPAGIVPYTRSEARRFSAAAAAVGQRPPTMDPSRSINPSNESARSSLIHSIASATNVESRVKAENSPHSSVFAVLGPTPFPVTINEKGQWDIRT